MQDTHIALAHGNGGRFMQELIQELFARHLANPDLDTRTDAAPLPSLPGGDVLVSTDGFTVQPLEFPSTIWPSPVPIRNTFPSTVLSRRAWRSSCSNG
jgi:hypothetical protein